ncbi:membrane protein [Legionella antarctica]|uniref:Membrane protein n=1 Tax=Legionella antarctica TaxID=2708020 RepID=A0A6F8T4E7_9GAMM|nr:LegC2/C7 family Dot/Icm T4SS effector [Legionella antarctica]BCA94836.1 membrane protein [Legionella antarctica]
MIPIPETIQQDEATELNPKDIKSKKIKENLEQVLLSQKELDQIKENLNRMIEAMAHNPSFLSRAAAYWGELPLWQKIVAGIVLVVPTFVISLVAHIAVIFTFSLFTLFTYTASSILLDNHHHLNIDRTEHLKAGINSLADTLGLIILSLDKIREQLAVEIEHFQKENEKLDLNIDELKAQIQELSEQSMLFEETERGLRETNGDLVTLTESLKDSVKEHTRLLENCKEQLRQMQQNYEKAQFNLTEKVAELNQVKLGMSEEIERVKGIAGTLQGTVQTLSTTLLLDETQQQAFKEKLESFINNKETSFHQIAERICEAERQLAIVKEEYERLNEQYQQLLERGKTQIDRLEQLHSVQAKSPPTTRPTTNLNTFGMFADQTADFVIKDNESSYQLAGAH